MIKSYLALYLLYLEQKINNMLFKSLIQLNMALEHQFIVKQEVNKLLTKLTQEWDL
jgi:hypothetical protein